MQKVHYELVKVLVRPNGKPYNPGGAHSDTTTLQASLRRFGQRTPIITTRPDADGIYYITQGHGRKVAIDILRKGAQTKEEKDRWSWYLIEENGIDSDDLDAVLRDMDAGTIQRDINPIDLGETIGFRMLELDWTEQQCCESLGLTPANLHACLRAANPNLTAPSVQQALRSGQMSLSTFARKFARMDARSQDALLREAQKAAEGSRGSGVVSRPIVDRVIASMGAPQESMLDRDAHVLSDLGESLRLLKESLAIRDEWTEATSEKADYWIGLMIRLLDEYENGQEVGR